MADRRDPGTAQIAVTVRYFAAARAAAGIASESVVLAADRAANLGSVVAVAVGRHGPPLEQVLRRCSYLVDEVAAHGAGTPVRDGTVIDVLPPFAGG